MTDFFKHGNKVYSENLNDSILIGNSFDWTVNISLPGDTGGVFPNSTTVVKAKVADVSATPNSNLSIGETITNNAGSSQVYRLTVYPNFNRYGGFTSVSLVGDGSVIITEKDGTSPVRNNLDYSNLGDVTELKTLKEYDIVVTIPSGGVVTGLSFGFKSSSADVTASINQSNVAGLDSDLSGIRDDLSSLESGKASLGHTHSTDDVVSIHNLPNIGASAGDNQKIINRAIDNKVGSLDNSITNINTYTTYIDNENYTVRYNDYRVIIDVHLSSTSFPPTLSNFGADVIPSDCLPSQPVNVPVTNVNAIVSIRGNSQGIWRKSNTGSAIQGVSCYAHIEYSRV